MIIIPAIDIIGGNCVRLQKGDYNTAHEVFESVEAAADVFAESGAGFLHIVDLDGAKEGAPKNKKQICRVAKKISLPVEVGGGIRTMKDVREYIEEGVSRVILGSAALSNPDFVKEAVSAYGGKIAVGIDALDRKVRAEGWLTSSKADYIEFAKEMEKIGVQNIIFTDISRDGMLTGPNLEQLAELKMAVSCKITASGGVRDLENIRALKELALYGAICGKALYSGTLNLAEAVAFCEEA